MVFRNHIGRIEIVMEGWGILIYVREDIPSKLLNKHAFPNDIEGLFIEVNLRKTKWLIFGTYHPPSQRDEFYFDSIGRALFIIAVMIRSF